jgi:hypothetical protein
VVQIEAVADKLLVVQVIVVFSSYLTLVLKLQLEVL